MTYGFVNFTDIYLLHVATAYFFIMHSCSHDSKHFSSYRQSYISDCFVVAGWKYNLNVGFCFLLQVFARWQRLKILHASQGLPKSAILIDECSPSQDSLPCHVFARPSGIYILRHGGKERSSSVVKCSASGVFCFEHQSSCLNLLPSVCCFHRSRIVFRDTIGVAP